MPLTNSLYVKGKLADPDRVIVDVGTGFYVEKDTKSAADFYEDKVKTLNSNIQDLEAILQGKSNNLRVVEEGESNQNPFSISFPLLSLASSSITAAGYA